MRDSISKDSWKWDPEDLHVEKISEDHLLFMLGVIFRDKAYTVDATLGHYFLEYLPQSVCISGEYLNGNTRIVSYYHKNEPNTLLVQIYFGFCSAFELTITNVSKFMYDWQRTYRFSHLKQSVISQIPDEPRTHTVTEDDDDDFEDFDF